MDKKELVELFVKSCTQESKFMESAYIISPILHKMSTGTSYKFMMPDGGTVSYEKIKPIYLSDAMYTWAREYAKFGETKIVSLETDGTISLKVGKSIINEISVKEIKKEC